MEETALALLQPLFPVAMGIRLLGVTLSTLAADDSASEEGRQLSLWQSDP
jgi:DNA polymerase-4